MSYIGRSALIAGMSLVATGCGKKGPLIYPDMLVPAAPSAVIVQQSGSAVKLKFSLPRKDRAGRPVDGVAGVKISRRTTGADQKDVCRSCTTDYILFRTLYLDSLPADTQRIGGQLILRDSDVNAGNIYSYRIVPFTADRVDGVSSAQADARVDSPLAAPGLKIESFPTELKLFLSYSTTLKSGRLVGYNVYRSSGTAPQSHLPLNSDPVMGKEYVDTGLERGVKYRYSARAVVMRASGGVAESIESREVEGILKDDE
ncbi:MAG: hypothetical protein A2076_15375 [Geobacteraceae bacterium GWC2_53_11]|nr:MAG: hypothetical protein A2076_15375 [Geobacteraceae bacterium GWC2_53_11]